MCLPTTGLAAAGIRPMVRVMQHTPEGSTPTSPKAAPRYWQRVRATKSGRLVGVALDMKLDEDTTPAHARYLKS